MNKKNTNKLVKNDYYAIFFYLIRTKRKTFKFDLRAYTPSCILNQSKKVLSAPYPLCNNSAASPFCNLCVKVGARLKKS